MRRSTNLCCILLFCACLLCSTACATAKEPPPGTGIVEGFESAPSSSALTESQTTSGSPKASSGPATSAGVSSVDATELKSLCNKYAMHNLVYTVAQYSVYSKIKYSFLSSKPLLTHYYAVDTSKKDLHSISDINGQINETYYSQSRKVLFVRQDDELLQANEELYNQFDFDAQTAALAPKAQKLRPEDISSYNTDNGKITFQIKNTENFADLYEDVGADPSNTMSITFYGENADELYETITIKGTFTVGGQRKTGTATIEQESHRLWNVPTPEWLENS